MSDTDHGHHKDRDAEDYPRHIITRLNAGVVVGASLVAIAAYQAAMPAATFAVIAGCIVGAGISQWCLRLGVRQSAIVLCTNFWLMTAANSLAVHGVHAAGMVLFPFVVAMSGWLLGVRWLLSSVLASIFFIVGLGLAEGLGWFHPPTRPSFVVPTAVYAAVLPLIAYVTWAARAALDAQYRRAQAATRELEIQYGKVQQSQAELRLLMENIPAAVAWLGPDKTTRRCNQRYADLYGVRAEELQGVSTDAYLPDVVRELAAKHWEAVIQGQPQSYRRFHVHPVSSEVTWLEVALWPDVTDGTVHGVYCCALDVTDKVQAEAQLLSLNMELEQRVEARTQELLQAQEKLQASREELLRSQGALSLVAMVAGVAHELGTPVGNSRLAASTSMDLLQSVRSKLDTGQLTRSELMHGLANVQEGLGMVQANLARANSLLQNFRQVSADQASEQRRTFDLAETVSEVVGSMAPMLRRRPHQLQVDIPPGIAMDSLPGPLGQVLINLINNAYGHAFDGMAQGSLVVSARQEAPEHVLITVEDNGCGMSEEVLKRLFEPFFSTRIGRGGTGLGMDIVRRIVERMLGGSIAVHSTPGRGTRFVIDLPLNAPLSEQVQTA